MKNVLVSLIFVFGIFAQAQDKSEHFDGHVKFPKNGVHAHLFWEAGPNNGKESVLRVEFKNAKTHKPIEPQAQLTVVLWSTEMGHGSEPTIVKQVLNKEAQPEKGVYRVSQIFFSMEGNWELRLHLKDSKGKTETELWKVSIKP